MRLHLANAHAVNQLHQNAERLRAWEEWLAAVPDPDALMKAVLATTRDEILVGDYLEDWVERRRQILKPTSHHGYLSAIRCYLVPRVGDLPLSKLDRGRIQALYDELLRSGGRGGRPLAPATVYHCHAILNRALEDAVLDGLIARNHARTVRPPIHYLDQKDVTETFHVWSVDEARRFLAAVEGHPWRAIWHLALGSGLRRGEILGLRWSDVDIEAGAVRVRRGLSRVDGVFRLLTPKTSRQRRLHVGKSVADALERWREEQESWKLSDPGWLNDWDLVFTRPDGHPIDPMSITREFRRLVPEIPVPTIRFHDLRHTHASLLLAADVPIRIVSDRLGHANIKLTLDIYGHLLPGMDAEVAETLDAMLAAEPQRPLSSR